MRVGLNLLHAWPDVGGVWNYMAGLVAAMATCDDRNSYLAFTNSASETLVPARPSFSKVRVRLPAGTRGWRIVYENTILQAQAARHGLDCVHWFAGVQGWWNAVPAAVSIYDLQPFSNPKDFSRGKRFYLKAMMTRTVRRAAVLLPMSHATAEALRSRWRVNRMVVIPPVLNDRFVPAEVAAVERFKRRLGLPDRTWLYVAHFYNHKNHSALLEAYKRLRAVEPATWPLVLRGDPAGADVPGTVERLGLSPHVIMLPPLSADELPLLYSAATALVYPSSFEGGGLPVVEAMACGCPLALARIASLEEYAGDAAEYFDPADVDAIQAVMARFQSSRECRERIAAFGLARVENFRAPNIVPRLVEAYRMAAGRAGQA